MSYDVLRTAMIGFAKIVGNYIITLDAVKLITSAKPIHNCNLKKVEYD